MSGISRAYRDKNSPFQPLTPLSVNGDFSFNIGGDGSLNPWIDQINAQRGKTQSKPHSQLQHQQQTQQCCASHLRQKLAPIAPKRPPCKYAPVARVDSPLPRRRAHFLNLNAAALEQHHKRSPILKPNSRMFSMLECVGMVQYWDFLRQRGINFAKFQRITIRELECLGIRNLEHILQLLKAVEMARELY